MSPIYKLSANSLALGRTSYRDFLMGNPTFISWYPQGAMDAIGSVLLTTSQSSINFSAIPQTYTHLQISITALPTAGNNPYMQVGNGSIDTGNNYSWHHLWGTGSAPNSNSSYATSSSIIGYAPSTTYPMISIIDLFDYTNTSKNKTFKTLSGCDAFGGTMETAVWGGSWNNTAAINTITLTPASGSWAAGTVVNLYGIR